MITEAGLTVAGLKARAVDVEMERPVETPAGRIATALMVLIDLRTDGGPPAAPTSVPTPRSPSSP